MSVAVLCESSACVPFARSRASIVALLDNNKAVAYLFIIAVISNYPYVLLLIAFLLMLQADDQQLHIERNLPVGGCF